MIYKSCFQVSFEGHQTPHVPCLDGTTSNNTASECFPAAKAVAAALPPHGGGGGTTRVSPLMHTEMRVHFPSYLQEDQPLPVRLSLRHWWKNGSFIRLFPWYNVVQEQKAQPFANTN